MMDIGFRDRSGARAVTLALLFASACGADSESGEIVDLASGGFVAAPGTAAPEPPTLPSGPATSLPPNELGDVLVLEYHRLGEPEGEFRRSAASFRRDLEMLYDAGYRPVTVRQLLDGDIDLPVGTSPVVFTIDDSSTGQFHLLDDGSIDPESMVGMWMEFARANPEWAGGATWCVLPAADHPSNFFGEKPSREIPRAEREARIAWKVDFLVSNGHEICNHTLYHARLDRARDDLQVQEWIGRGEDSIQVYLPDGYDVVTLALPLGMWPKNRELAMTGTHAGRGYSYRGVLEVTGGPNPSPFHADFDPASITRVIVAPGALERHLAFYERHPSRRYVSDGLSGTVAVPRERLEEYAAERWPHLRVVVVDPEDALAAASPTD